MNRAGGAGERLIGIMRDIGRRLDVRLLTFEYEIIVCLLDMQPVSPDDLATFSSASRTSFYSLLARMRADGLVLSAPDAADHRRKLYRLDPDLEALVVQQFGKYERSHSRAFHALGGKRSDLATLSEQIRRTSQVSHLTCAFQILLYLYISPGVANREFVSIVDVSASKFNESLRTLERRGLIRAERKPGDARSKVYYLADNVIPILQGLHARTSAWLAARTGG